MKNLYFIILIAVGLVSCNQPGTTSSESNSKPQALKERDTLIGDSAVQKGKKSFPKKIRYNLSEEPDSIKDMAMARNYNSGIQYYQKGKLNEALEQFKNALEKNPENSNVNHYLGRIYYDLGQKQLALSYYQDAARFNKSDSLSTLGAGQVFFDLGNYDSAMYYYNKSLTMAPHYALAYYNRGTLLGMQNKYVKAIDDLNKSIDLDPTNGNAFVNRGLAYYFLKQMNSACRDWKKAASMGIDKAQKAVDQYCN